MPRIHRGVPFSLEKRCQKGDTIETQKTMQGMAVISIRHISWHEHGMVIFQLTNAELLAAMELPAIVEC